MVRFKSRYLLCEIVFEKPHYRQQLDVRSIIRNVRNTISQIHGDFGIGCCSLRLEVTYLNAYTGIVLIRCQKDFYRMLSTALMFVTFLENKNQKFHCFFNTLHVAGTIRSCQKFLIQYNRKQLLLLLRGCKTKRSGGSFGSIATGFMCVIMAFAMTRTTEGGPAV
ncbi:ribonuclease P/MRP protein subunit POP5 isoform X3 [Hypanus sabinus]|uniref:ribonuclease P/MRP protein subunit POP5 isoform X3 n=1 Tax=Hypanus sabinus TaxID=79690 RepID=UPI0028C40C53|nr:ribonuclease P/MRP protein subunit POP5 isoform X3 [Hypanus sabinus]